MTFTKTVTNNGNDGRTKESVKLKATQGEYNQNTCFLCGLRYSDCTGIIPIKC